MIFLHCISCQIRSLCSYPCVVLGSQMQCYVATREVLYIAAYPSWSFERDTNNSNPRLLSKDMMAIPHPATPSTSPRIPSPTQQGRCTSLYPLPFALTALVVPRGAQRRESSTPQTATCRKSSVHRRRERFQSQSRCSLLVDPGCESQVVSASKQTSRPQPREPEEAEERGSEGRLYLVSRSC